MGDADNAKFVSIIKRYLLPFLGGAWIDGDCQLFNNKLRKSVATIENNLNLRLRSPYNWNCGIQIHRSQPFSPDEKELVEKFLTEAERFGDVNDAYFNDTAASVLTMTVAQFVSADAAEFLFKLLSTLAEVSQQTYEGQRIAWSIGVDVQTSVNNEAVGFFDIFQEDFMKVLSNGHDTLLVFDKFGGFVSHDKCVTNKKYPEDGQYSPIRFESLASWTTEKPNRVVVTLSRNGEILIFKEGSLLFAKRRGHWRYFHHDIFIRLMTRTAIAKNTVRLMRQEIYRTAMDVAFSRHGGCIGVFMRRDMKLGLGLVQSGDILSSKNLPHNDKHRVLSQIVCNQKFYELDRLLRLELASMDGAVVLDYQGNILALGAILQIQGASAFGGGRQAPQCVESATDITGASASGGGRQAAAMALATYGLGIKISNDGYIRGFGRDQMPQLPDRTPIFEIG